jgi:hypothetical protein
MDFLGGAELSKNSRRGSMTALLNATEIAVKAQCRLGGILR